MTTTTPRATRIVLRAARLFDGVTGALVPDPLVLIDGSRICAVDSGVRPPADAAVLDLPGATLLPGLIDTHVHLAFDASAEPVRRLGERTPDEALAAMTAAARAAARGGVTTVRDLGDRDYLALELRGRPGLPTIVAAGPPLTTPGGHCHFLGGATGRGATAVRRAVRDHVERGVDVVKVMASGGNLTPGSRPEDAQFTSAELRAAVDEAHRNGLPITAHAHGISAIAGALSAGVDGLEHVTFWTSDGISAPPELIQHIADCRVIVGATLGVRSVPGATVPPPVAARAQSIRANLRRLRSAGASIVAGSDAGLGAAKPHDAARYAYAALLDIGCSPAEAMRTLTSAAAAVCGLAHRKGRLAPGYDGDIVAVDGDPFADPAAIHRLRAVYVGGRPVLSAAPPIPNENTRSRS
ncbi:MAG: amidohydrolase family protein [Streptosporangiales bacterium]|nr:amidohydrolase family protein [Streptosporangiales bacterium]